MFVYFFINLASYSCRESAGERKRETERNKERERDGGGRGVEEGGGESCLQMKFVTAKIRVTSALRKWISFKVHAVGKFLDSLSLTR